MKDETKVSTEMRYEGGVATSLFSGHPPVEMAGLMVIEKKPKAWDPPHMLVAATESCFFLTFTHIAAKMRAEIAEYSSEAYGIFGSPDGEHHEFSEIVIKPKIRLKGGVDAQRLAKLVKMAEEHCPVARSLKIPVRVEI